MTTARSHRRLARTAAVLIAATVAGAAMPAAEAKPPKGDTARISEGPKGERLDGNSSALGLSTDGRSALFSSTATNLLPGTGTPNSDEVYVRNLRNGHLERVSVADDGSRLNAPTTTASISGDGRYVAFSTTATNVVPGQPAHASDVFVRDRWTGHTELVTAAALPGTGDQSAADALSPSISGNGRYVAYVSDRTDLAPGVDTHGRRNVYVADRWTHTSRLVTVGADGQAADRESLDPAISADGSTVAFTSKARNLLPAAPAGPDPGDGTPGLASGPRSYPTYVWTAGTGTITGASLNEAGELEGSRAGRISPDGRYAVYSLAEDAAGMPGHGGARWDLYVHELATGKVTPVNPEVSGKAPKGHTIGGVMTADSRWVYFDSGIDFLVPGDTNSAPDVFRRDLWTGRIERVSLTRDGGQSTTSSLDPFVDASGDTVIFDGGNGNLVPGEPNDFQDVFLRRP
ncbi:TolB family protein [Kitasatospora sp. NPDC056783]|uniref:TolB family protein n=1 Tax=Kitasatospora sp. NPDC056783 TaxID=3345943 RepID=UPI00367FCBB2